MPLVLDHEIEASQRAADELGDEIIRESHRAQICLDVRDLVELIVRLYEGIGQHVESWQSSVEGRAIRDDEAISKQEELWFSLYQKLERVAVTTIPLIKYVQGLGFTVKTGEFKRSLRSLQAVTSFDLNRVRAGFRSIDSGKGVPLDECFNALQVGTLD